MNHLICWICKNSNKSSTHVGVVIIDILMKVTLVKVTKGALSSKEPKWIIDKGN